MDAEPRARSTWWYIKWLMATWGAGGGLILLVCVVALPFAGFLAFLEFFSERMPLYLLSGKLIVGPFTYRYLR